MSHDLPTPILVPIPRPYGTWPSPLSAAGLAAGVKRLAAPQIEGNRIFWVEGRPQEAGRSTVVCSDGNGSQEWVPAAFNVRSRVHEYGGGAYAVHGHRLWFVDDHSGQVFETTADGPCQSLTQPGPWRLGDLSFDPCHDRLLAVGERARNAGEPENAIVSINCSTGTITPLVQGRDFFASPRTDPQGKHLAYVAWDHPHMPWDAAAVFVCTLSDDGVPNAPRHIAGDQHASALAPTWSPDGKLAFAWEQTGYWNLFLWQPNSAPSALAQIEAEFALPLWQLGMRTFAWLDQQTLACAFTREGRWHVANLDVATRTLGILTSELQSISHLHAQAGRIVVLAAAPALPSTILEVKLNRSVSVCADSLLLDPVLADCISEPQALCFPTTGHQSSHAFFYPPVHARYVGSLGEKPPVLVLVHGGPTAATAPAFNPAIQFWTTRGFAVLDVNYRGSTGYGRAYRDLLNGQWGVADVEDCVAAALHVAELGLVDGKRMAIRGSSAGGFTTLAALTFHNVFSAGASLYGVSDLEALIKDTHKFEAHYLDTLIGPYPACAELYRARSPLHSVHALNTPVIFFQGQDDRVVPPNQTEAMVMALRARQVQVEYLSFEGEQHGFRAAETITRVYERELAFYGKVFGFVPAS